MVDGVLVLMISFFLGCMVLAFEGCKRIMVKRKTHGRDDLTRTISLVDRGGIMVFPSFACF